MAIEKSKKWYAVYTKFKCEKKVADELERKEIVVFLPLQEVIRKYPRKVKRYQIPLITCYVFVNISDEERITVLQTSNVARFLSVEGKPAVIRESEIETLKKLVAYGVELEVNPIGFEEGDRVVISKGMLLGLEGKIIKKQGKNKFLISLPDINQAFAVEVPIEFLLKVT